MSIDLSEMSVNRSTRKAFGISFFLHILFISFFITSALCPPPPQPAPRRLVVQSIALRPSSLHSIAVRPGPASKSAGKASQPSAPPPPQPPVEKPEDSSPAQVAMAEPEEAKASEEATLSQKAHEPASLPEPSLQEEDEPPAKKHPSSAEPASHPKTSSAKSTKLPSKALPSAQGKPLAQPSAKKQSHQTSPQPSSKTSTKPSTSKGPSSAAQKSKINGSSATNGSSPHGSSKKPSSSQTPAYDQTLLNEALQRLDKSKSATKGCGSGSRGYGGGNGGGQGTARVGAVGALNIEQGFGENSSPEDSPFQGYSSASPEAYYIGDLIRRLQLNVRLPEPGEVRVKLTLKRNGSVAGVAVLSGKTTSIKRSIEEKLRTIHFSQFGASFSGEAEHSFLLRLSNELVWSCS